MTQVGYLLDENVPAAVGRALTGVEPAVRWVHVGVDPDAPPKGTPDPDVLAYAAENGFTLVTFDKRTMPGHAAAFVAAGGRTWGVFVFAAGSQLSSAVIAEQLLLAWVTTAADEWVDRVEYLPFRPPTMRG